MGEGLLPTLLELLEKGGESKHDVID